MIRSGVVRKSELSGWGRTFVPGHERRSEDLSRITKDAALSRGLGRSYGDASLPASPAREVVGTTLADRMLSFDETTGVLRAESGFTLNELYRLFLRRGFFTPVTPGTKFVTLGGMVAADVHGKNHHVAGTIGRHVRALRLRVADGRIIECSREHERELFLATIGGMGLTGHILEVELTLARVPSPYIYQETFRIPDLWTFLEALKSGSAKWPFTVGWIDTVARGNALGRGILFCGRWAEAHEAPAQPPSPKRRLSFPVTLPSGLLNRTTMGLFNEMVYRQHLSQHRVGIVDADTFFYPLDFIHHWNRGYGPRGVTQHQCVLPHNDVEAGVRDMIQILSQHGTASFLTVIKDCGDEGEGLLSFPRPGVSLALDIPIRDNIQEVIDALNERVVKGGGRIYLAKDGYTRAEDFAKMEPRLSRFLAVKHKWDPHNKLRSAQSQRLFAARS